MIELLAPGAAVAFTFPLWRRHLYGIFFVILLTTEFYYVDVGGGTARIYHFLAAPLVLLTAGTLPRLFRSRVFLLSLLFIAINISAIFWSEAPDKAAASFSSFVANFCVAVVTANILIGRRMTLKAFNRLLIGITLVSIGWGLLQIVLHRFTGIVAALSESQIAQIESGFGPSFRTEADTFGKFMVVPFMLYLPAYLERRVSKRISWIFVAFLAGMLANFTRSGIYGIAAATPVVVWSYVTARKGAILVKRTLPLFAAAATGITLLVLASPGQHEYAAYKILNLFNSEEVLEGGSSSYRLEVAEALVHDTFSSTKRIIIGNGWGQTRTDVRGVEVQAGAGDALTIWAFGGVFAALVYAMYMWVAFRRSRVAASRALDPEVASFALGSTFAVCAFFVTAQIAGGITAPEYWLLMGIVMFLEVTARDIRRTHNRETSPLGGRLTAAASRVLDESRYRTFSTRMRSTREAP